MYRAIVSWNSAMLAGAVLLLAGGPAAAIDITTVPFTIMAPGEYHLTKDWLGVSDGITVQASNVRLYLDNHTLISSNGTGTGVRVGAFTNVLVQGGTLKDFAFGVRLEGTTSATLSALNTEGSGGDGLSLFNVRSSAVLNCVSSGDADGIDMQNGGGNTIRSCRVTGSKFEGISVFETSNNLVHGNTVQSADQGISLMNATNNLVQDNNLSLSVREGIHLQNSTNNRIRTNWVQFNGTHGIHVRASSGNTVELNRANGNTNIGVFLSLGSNSNNVVANTATQNGTGIWVDGSTLNVVQNNILTGSFGAGIELTKAVANRILSNQSENNMIGITLSLDGNNRNTVQYNRARNNTVLGIQIAAGSIQNNILSNAATGNGFHDLFDGNANCDQNTWFGNTFGTKNQACVK